MPPGNLKYFRKDPMARGRSQGRGAGWYYKRHYNGNPNHWSKYDETRDANKYRKRTKVPKGGVKKAEKEAPHKGDYKTRGRGANRKVSRLPRGKIKGYF